MLKSAAEFIGYVTLQLGRLEMKGKMGRDLRGSSAGSVLGCNTLHQGGWMALVAPDYPLPRQRSGKDSGAKGNTEGDLGHCRQSTN